ncbi:MAG: S9 family peptidase [Maricaulaceae bacterium]
MGAPQPPRPEPRPITITQHGVTRTDPYAWLRDDNWQAVMRDPSQLRADIRAHLEAENAYAEAITAPLAALRAELRQEMADRIDPDDASAPQPYGRWAYGRRYRPGGEHAIVFRRAYNGDLDALGPEQVLVDGDKEAEGRAFSKILAAEPSPDHRRIAFAHDTGGAEIYAIRVRDCETGDAVGPPIEDGAGGFAWAADGRTLFWVWRDDHGRPAKVFRRDLDASSPDDQLVYEETDPGFFLGLETLSGQRFIAIVSHASETSEIRIVPTDDPKRPPQLLAARETGVEYEIDDFDGGFAVLTNADGATDFKVCWTPYDSRSRADWRPLVAPEPGVHRLAILGFANYLVRLERADALPRLVVRARDTGAEHPIAFDQPAYTLAPLPGYAYDAPVVRFAYASPAEPDRVIDYDMAARTRTTRKIARVPSGHDPAAYRVERFSIPAQDGAAVPVTVLRRADTALDGSAPLLLYGYGSYGIPMEADFRANRLSLVDRGFVYAVAHIRGGSENGRRWYLDGKLDKKTNTFEDFITVGRGLVERGYGAADKIVAMGGSAGGLLMGAAVNQAPDLFKGVIAQVPFVDVLNTMSDPDLPLTPPEWPEWGDPITDPAAFKRIAAYSPYENLEARDYPAVLAITGLCDPRVTYWEPAKWIARLRAVRTDAGVSLLRTDMTSGHAGAAGRYDGLDDVAYAYAFALWAVGWTPS